MSRVLSTFLVLTLICCHFSVRAQNAQSDQNQHFRYFVLQAESIDDGSLAKLQKSAERHDAIRISQFCPGTNQVLYSVKADYPHRIDAISAEIESIFLSQARKSGFRSIEAVPVSEITNFCK